MKQIFFIFSFFLLGSLLFTSCKSKQFPEERNETIIHKTEFVKDTVLVVEKDSSYYSAYIDCVNGKPVLVQSKKQIEALNNKNPNQAVSAPKSISGRSVKPPTVNIENGLLTVNCEKEAEKLFFTWKQQFIKEQQINYQPVYREKELTTFQKVKMAIGNIVFWLLCGVIAAFGIRFIITKKLF
ncbi:MAG: hypothetical protein QM564_11090 [Bergeyella sp.]